MLLKIILKVTKNQSLALSLSLALSPSLSLQKVLLFEKATGEVKLTPSSAFLRLK